MLLAHLLIWSACETPFVPDTSAFEETYVVEGFVEWSDSVLMPTYVLLYKALPFIGTVSSETIHKQYVHGANVSVTDDEGVTVQLHEYCLRDLDSTLADIIRSRLITNQVFDDLCVYIDDAGLIKPKIGGQYDLTIQHQSIHLAAHTTIPSNVKPMSLYHEPAPGGIGDSLVEFGVTFHDPEDQVNYYRYKVGVNEKPVSADFSSVFDDVFLNGQTISFPVPRPTYPDEELDILTSGYYHPGDTVQLWVANVDRDHFDFWQSLEFDTSNGGPFANYTRAKSNIIGGLGIWGGYSSSSHLYIIPK